MWLGLLSTKGGIEWIDKTEWITPLNEDDPKATEWTTVRNSVNMEAGDYIIRVELSGSTSTAMVDALELGIRQQPDVCTDYDTSFPIDPDLDPNATPTITMTPFNGTPVPTFDICTGQCPTAAALDVPAWLDYEFCGVKQFVSWCPAQSMTLAAIPTYFTDKEPIGTIDELLDTGSAMSTQVASYGWVPTPADDGKGTYELMSIPDVSMFIIGPTSPEAKAKGNVKADSPYNGGKINFMQSDVKGASKFQTDCYTRMMALTGTGMAPGLCYAFNVIIQKGLWAWLQFFINVFAMFFIVKDLYGLLKMVGFYH